MATTLARFTKSLLTAVTPETYDRVTEEAAYRSVHKSDIVREALADYFANIDAEQGHINRQHDGVA